MQLNPLNPTQQPTVEQTLHNQVILVTGASHGIGAATAKLLAAHGAAVGANYHQNEQEAHKIVQEIKDAGGHALALQANVGDASQVKAMVKRAEEELGPIDTVVMNAIAARRFVFASFADIAWEDFQDMVLGELAGIYFPAKAVAPLMVQRKRGHLIAISSGLGRLGFPGTIAHAVGKSGVDAMVRVLAQEYGPYGIRVNTIAPGKVKTDQNTETKHLIDRAIPLGYIAQPEDIAGAIYLLALKEAQYITGAYISVNGGSHMP